ncbi:MAG: lipopolysaccharide biosynthesis protein [Ruminococcus sp.]|uniref:lipopolysaccharide biosynthesis protein n=1 Tax=Ruminococcus sp. TaxID=41978 RepID=UPI001B1FE1F6|nr:lipopolysaccharide biosynthesis protein [Ruminococcus sp.]MBO7473944.1 lipopolysaccharide biosynthesis protein [Ruminococcus sp.]
MAKNNGRDLNITIKNQEDEDRVIISFSSVFRQLKRFLVLWIVLAIIAGIAVFSLSALKTFSSSYPAQAIISFTYDGIEQGLDPKKGGKFDIETVKSPKVIEMALTEMGIDLEMLESVRSNIRFQYIIPQDAYDKFKVYNSVMDKASSGVLSAAQEMLDVKYYPTKYTVIFDYGNAGFDKITGAELLNTLLECYGDYFYQLYGFNKPLGAAVTAVDTDSYDYAQQVDLYKDSLRELRSYLNDLDEEDNTAFRSSVTGYTFNDLSEYAKTVTSIDLDRISSYIAVNNVTKNKDSAIAYYDYRIENLSREKEEYEERVRALDASIDKYIKDQITVYGETADVESTVHSEQYDAMFKQKTTVEALLAQTKQDIKFYESRRDALKSNKSSSKANIEKTEADLAALNKKVNDIVDLTEKTANDYFENVQFANAYTVLAPATKSASASLGEAVSNSLKFIIVFEMLIFAVYLAIAFISAILNDNKKKAVRVDGGDDDDDDLEDVIEAVEEAAEKADEKNIKKSKKK